MAAGEGESTELHLLDLHPAVHQQVDHLLVVYFAEADLEVDPPAERLEVLDPLEQQVHRAGQQTHLRAEASDHRVRLARAGLSVAGEQRLPEDADVVAVEGALDEGGELGEDGLLRGVLVVDLLEGEEVLSRVVLAAQVLGETGRTFSGTTSRISDFDMQWMNCSVRSMCLSEAA